MTYRPEFQSRTTSFDVRVERSLSYLQVKDDLYVYKLLYTHKLPEATPSSIALTYKDKEAQGFAKLAALQDFSDNKVDGITKEGNLTLVPEGFLDMAQLKGYVVATEHFEKEFPYQTTPEVYDAFVQSEVPLDRVVQVDRSSHMLFDRLGNALPTAIYFDYMRGQMDESTYDLEKAIEILSKDSRITPVGPDSYRDAKGPSKLKFYDIPYYNSGPGRRKTLPFIFSPTKENMVALWAKAIGYRTNYPSTKLHDAVFDLDMLGLRAAGAAKFVNFSSTQTA